MLLTEGFFSLLATHVRFISSPKHLIILRWKRNRCLKSRSELSHLDNDLDLTVSRRNQQYQYQSQWIYVSMKYGHWSYRGTKPFHLSGITSTKRVVFRELFWSAASLPAVNRMFKNNNMGQNGPLSPTYFEIMPATSIQSLKLFQVRTSSGEIHNLFIQMTIWDFSFRSQNNRIYFRVTSLLLLIEFVLLSS